MSLKLITLGVLLSGLTLAGLDSYTIIDPNERGIDVRLGEMQNEVIQPGIHFRTPFITSTKKFALKPKVYEVTFSVGSDGAITKDMQTVGATVAVRYVYDESRIKDIVTQYANDSVIEGAMRDNVKASLKETTGKYSIYDLVAHQNEITAEVANAMLTRMSNYPIAINQTTITNWDWSEDFDRQIKETANRTQQKLVRQAEAQKQAAELDAQAEIARANGMAESKKIKADAQAYENQKIAQNLDVMKAQWDYEVSKIRASKFNGVEVSSQSVYVPNTYDLKSGR